MSFENYTDPIKTLKYGLNTYQKIPDSTSTGNIITVKTNVTIDESLDYCNLNINCKGFIYDKQSHNSTFKDDTMYPTGQLSGSPGKNLYIKINNNDTIPDSLKILEENGNDMTAYNFLSRSINSAGSNNGLDISRQIIDSINTNLAELNYIQNQLNTLNNVNQESLLKQEQLLQLENEDLMKQLKELENMQSVISNKDRMIEQTNQNIENTDINIRVLMVSILGAIILFVTVGLYYFGIIDDGKLTIIIIAIIVIYLSIVIYSYNIFYVRNSISYLSDKKIQRISDSIQDWSNKKYNELEEEIYGNKDTWVDNNCSCPATSKVADEEGDGSQYYANTGANQTPGHFYYDGTAPPQLLVPSPTHDNSGTLKQTIDWVDYSNNGTVVYNKNKNEVYSTNNEYYNYKNKNDPRNVLQHKLDKSRMLVNNTTYTKNM